jgi:phosphoribosyl-dephospho-CoA transferase
MNRVPRVHDLLLLRSASMMSAHPEQPAWIRSALGREPWVVVRRALSPQATIAIGIRGTQRHERWGGYVNTTDIMMQRGPEQLHSRLAQKPRLDLPAFRSLTFLEDHLAGVGLEWGPAGSVGFELASGKPVVKDQSDLDIVFFAPGRFDRKTALDLWKQVSASPGTVDALVETPYCGFSLLEYSTGHSKNILLRTAGGRVLGPDPWALPDTRDR